MNAHDIEKIIARHILQEGSLDKFLATPDRSQATQDLLDMLVQERRRRVLNDLKPIAAADTAEILKAFQTFGAFETSLYINRIAGSHELTHIEFLFMAARKMGHPEESWDQVKAYMRQASSMDIKNPQMQVARPYEKAIHAAIDAVYEESVAIENFPYIPDRVYLNSIQISRTFINDDHDHAARASHQLMTYVLNQYDQCPSMTVDQELQWAGILVLACRSLPGSSGCGQDITARSIQEQLSAAHAVCVSDEKNMQTVLMKWMPRDKNYSVPNLHRISPSSLI